jgi:hypothetical protein
MTGWLAMMMCVRTDAATHEAKLKNEDPTSQRPDNEQTQFI